MHYGLQPDRIDVDKVVKKISLLYSTSIETPTSFALAKEIVDSIDVDFTNPTLKFLDPSCGRGTYLLALINKLQNYHSLDHIANNMIYGCDVSSVQSAIAEKAVLLATGFKGNIICQDTLEYNFKQKFDVVLGGPPFQSIGADGKRLDQANNQWTKFVNKAITELVKVNGFVAMVTPNSWLSPSADVGKGNTGINFYRDYFQVYKTHKINIDECGKHFATGSNFTYFVLQKQKPKKSFETKFVTVYGTTKQDLKQVQYLPNVVSTESLSINKKVLESNKQPFGFSNNNLPETKVEYSRGEKTKEFKVAAYHTPARGGTFWYVKEPIKNSKTPKVIVSISGKYIPFYDHGGMSYTGMCLVYNLKENETLDNVKSIIESKLYKFVINNTTLTGWLSPVFRNLPRLDPTRKWTDAEIYDAFNLTKQEIKLIEGVDKPKS